MGNSFFNIENINKSFDGVSVLKNFSIDIGQGEVRGLVGENGAGKSTISKIIAGVQPADNGSMKICGDEYCPKNILDAHTKGVSIIYQEPSLEMNLCVAENIFIGNLKENLNKYFLLNWNKLYEKAEDIFSEIGVDFINPRDPVCELDLGKRKIIELARAILFNPKILVVDEATAALNAAEVKILFSNIRKLKETGTSIIYISHRLEEIFEICDAVTVLRDGVVIDTVSSREVDERKLSSMMVGREISLWSDVNRKKKKDRGGTPLLEYRNVTGINNSVQDISFRIYPGEIVGFGGLVGAGNETILEILFGIKKISSGEIILNGKHIENISISDAIKNKISYVPKERDEEGLITLFSVKENMNIIILKELMKGFFISNSKMNSHADKYINDLRIKTPSNGVQCSSLSGGNRQKVVLGKWLSTDPVILVLNNPTRGVDIGAKSEIYKLIYNLANRGVAVIISSDELPELIGLSDIFYIMKNGELKKLFYKKDAPTEEEIITYML